MFTTRHSAAGCRHKAVCWYHNQTPFVASYSNAIAYDARAALDDQPFSQIGIQQPASEFLQAP
jgi:hypothetical protein